MSRNPLDETGRIVAFMRQEHKQPPVLSRVGGPLVLAGSRAHDINDMTKWMETETADLLVRALEERAGAMVEARKPNIGKSSPPP